MCSELNRESGKNMLRRWWPVLISLMLVAVGIAAGNWQTRRGDYKESLRARYEAMLQSAPVRLDVNSDVQQLDMRRVQVSGYWQKSRTIFLDNRVHDGVPGYHAITPLCFDQQHCVPVNRGWLPRTRLRSELPNVTEPDGVIQISALSRLPPGQTFALGPEEQDSRLWQQFDLVRYAKWTGREQLPLLLQQTNDTQDGLVRTWERVDFGIDKHRGYAFQWYGLALLSLVFAFIFCYRQLKTEER